MARIASIVHYDRGRSEAGIVDVAYEKWRRLDSFGLCEKAMAVSENYPRRSLLFRSLPGCELIC